MGERRSRSPLGIALATALALLAPATASAGTITVTQLNDGYDDNGLCTLREAISAAQGNGTFNTLDCDAGNDDNADTIVIPSGNTIPLTREGIDDTNVNGDLDETGVNPGDNTLTITSSGATRAGIDASALGDVNPANGDRVLETIGIAVGQALTDFRIENIEITGGTAPAAGLRGAGLRLSGFTTATLTNVYVHDNSAGAAEAAGGLHSFAQSLTINSSRFENNDAGFAGGLWIEAGNVTVNQTTVDHNSATSSGGSAGGLAVGGNSPNVTIKNSTIAVNDAGGGGGGLSLSNGSSTLSNVTLASNTADADNMGGENGGGIEVIGGTLNARNSIVADNNDVSTGAHECSGTINSQGYNLIERTAGCTFTPSNDITGVDPKLNSLQGAGSPWTHWRMPLLTGSPAFNAGNPATPDGISPNCETTDQEGNARPFNGTGIDRCDIGAVEMSAGDADGDAHFDGLDNCTSTPNPDQLNTDGDAEGDACDVDDDGDGIADGSDGCPIGAAVGTDTDGDGCKDAGEDADDDNDTVPDLSETGCPGGGISTDEDSDDDTVLDGQDVFPCDAAESADTDGDGVGNNGDACPTVAAATATGCPATASPAPGATATGQRASALKKCRKKKGRARAKCLKKARKLPL